MQRAEAGFTLIGLMVVIAIVNIGLGVAVASWTTIGKRAKETELIWRGQQYVRALQCHRQQTGALPDELDELLESDCIRALYPDPMARGGRWRLIHESDLQGGRSGDSSGVGSAARALDSIDRELRGPEAFFGDASPRARGGRSSSGARAGGGAAQGDSLQAVYERLSSLQQRLSESFNSGSGNGIVGVVSASTDEALRRYKGELTYDAWRFVAQ